MNEYTQDNRFLAISDFGLGKDTFLLTQFSGRESISDLFEFSLTVLSETSDINPQDVVGRTATVQIKNDVGRFFNGFVSHFTLGELKAHGLREYKMTLVPWLWFLSKNNNHRIFQGKTTEDIVNEVFSGLGFSDFSFKAEPGLEREYCVQHNESDLHFVSRLLEEEGIAYHFVHENGKHTLVMTDQNHFFQECDETDLEYLKGSLSGPQITLWEHDHALKTGQWTVSDYDFTTPDKSLLISTPALKPFQNSQSLEHYEYPDLYHSGSGNEQIKVRMETEESAAAQIRANSGYVSVYAGGRFKLAKHAIAEELGEYLITEVSHDVYDQSYLPDDAPKDGSKDKPAPLEYYQNNFKCIPLNTLFRPPRVHRRPVMRGVQSAVVVGPEGEEIYTDEFGRIKVQFMWDRLGEKNETSSCFLRVMQVWAGNKWGASFIPRIGHEVVVDFYDGDPDRPFVSGSVYNGKNKPPYESKTQSGIKSHSTKGATASNFNELRFEDKLGSEQVFLQAEKDYQAQIKNNESASVGSNASKNVGANDSLSVGGDHSKSIGANESITVGADRTDSVGANATENIGANRSETIGANRSSAVGANENINIAGNQSENIGGKRSLNIGSKSTEMVGSVKMTTVGAAYMLNVGAIMNEIVAGARLSETGAYSLEAVGGNKTVKIGGDLTISVGGKVTISSGAASIVLEGGNVTIKGGVIDLN